jgi:hypothetical protein
MRKNLNIVKLSPAASGDRTISAPPSINDSSDSSNFVLPWKLEIVDNNTTGTTDTYTLSNKPSNPLSISVFINGILQRLTVDFTIDDKTIIFSSIVPPGRSIQVFYSYLS